MEFMAISFSTKSQILWLLDLELAREGPNPDLKSILASNRVEIEADGRSLRTDWVGEFTRPLGETLV